MTSPDQLKVNLDQLLSAGSRWNVMTGDLEPGPPPSPGDVTNPTSLATAAIHGGVQLSSVQLQALLASYAGDTSQTATAFGAQEGQSAMKMSDLLNLVTSLPKEVTSAISPIASAASTAASSGASAVNSAMSAATGAIKPMTESLGKTNAPGGTVAGGLTSPDNLHHQLTTTQQGGERNVDADAVKQSA